MTFKFNNVYVQDSATVVGPYEKKGPNVFDKSYDDLYCSEKSWEDAEVRLLKDSVDVLLDKVKLKQENIDLMISGDLLNQITPSCYVAAEYNIPFVGVYSACASSVEGMILGSDLIDSNKISNCIVSTSSHNMTSEKQYRNPTEYGAPKPRTSTFTATGGASILLSNNKSKIKVESATIGRVIDFSQKDPFNMGAVMAPAAADTIFRHLNDTKRDASYYDLILTGDLGIYGKDILKDYMNLEYKIDVSKNHNDLGTLLYDLDKQKEVHAGGSGPVCSVLVLYSNILKRMKLGEIKRILFVATGALFSPTYIYQHKSINSIAHAISLEVVE